MLPKLRISPSRKGKRRSHQAISKVHTVTCPVTGLPKLPHAACPTSGYVRPGLQIAMKKVD